jgi:hypothetical protein
MPRIFRSLAVTAGVQKFGGAKEYDDLKNAQIGQLKTISGLRNTNYNNNNNNNNNNNKEKTCTLIDVAIPADRNVVQKEAEKKLKYQSLCIEIQRMWNLKCTIIPVITGASGIVTRSLGKIWKLYQENIR